MSEMQSKQFDWVKENPLVAIVGWKQSGKTTLLSDLLVSWLSDVVEKTAFHVYICTNQTNYQAWQMMQGFSTTVHIYIDPDHETINTMVNTLLELHDPSIVILDDCHVGALIEQGQIYKLIHHSTILFTYTGIHNIDISWRALCDYYFVLQDHTDSIRRLTKSERAAFYFRHIKKQDIYNALVIRKNYQMSVYHAPLMRTSAPTFT